MRSPWTLKPFLIHAHASTAPWKLAPFLTLTRAPPRGSSAPRGSSFTLKRAPPSGRSRKCFHVDAPAVPQGTVSVLEQDSCCVSRVVEDHLLFRGTPNQISFASSACSIDVAYWKPSLQGYSRGSSHDRCPASLGSTHAHRACDQAELATRDQVLGPCPTFDDRRLPRSLGSLLRHGSLLAQRLPGDARRGRARPPRAPRFLPPPRRGGLSDFGRAERDELGPMRRGYVSPILARRPDDARPPRATSAQHHRSRGVLRLRDERRAAEGADGRPHRRCRASWRHRPVDVGRRGS